MSVGKTMSEEELMDRLRITVRQLFELRKAGLPFFPVTREFRLYHSDLVSKFIQSRTENRG